MQDEAAAQWAESNGIDLFGDDDGVGEEAAVVDELNRVVGLVTRKEMLGFALDKKLGG